MSLEERYREAANNIKSLFEDSSRPIKHLDYYETLARSVKYNLDYRLKLVNIALQSGQLDIAAFTMFPSLNASGSLYARNNNYSTSGISSEGVTTGLSSSTPRSLRSARIAISWNLLDFGMGYVRAKQQSEKVLIAEEEARRQLQQLAQDVLVAYWIAYNAQQLITETKAFQSLLSQAKNKLEKAAFDKIVPKENLLNYQAALLEGTRRLIQLEYKYDKAMLDLKHLLFLPLDQKIILAKPPEIFFNMQSLMDLNLQKMDAVTLVKHPQLRGQNYQQRIAQLGLKTVILQALPGLTLNGGWNYNSNQFLLNNVWLDKSLDAAWNLLNIASLPTSYKTAQTQVHYEKLKSMALTMAALTETRYAFSRYQTLLKEYELVHKQTENSKALFNLNRDRELASLASDQQVILAKLRVITSKMDEELLLSDLAVALGQLYLSVGVDLIPADIIHQPLPKAIQSVRTHFALNTQHNFTHFINMEYDHLFKNTSNSQSFTLQIFGSYELDRIKAVQKTLNTPELKIAKTKHENRDWYILTYGNFNNKIYAKSQLNTQPEDLNDMQPWIRSINGIHWIG